MAGSYGRLAPLPNRNAGKNGTDSADLVSRRGLGDTRQPEVTSESYEMTFESYQVNSECKHITFMIILMRVSALYLRYTILRLFTT
jgi:hypothetical protein